MPVFTKNQISRFSNIFDNAGQVFMGSTVIPYFVSKQVTFATFVGIFITFSAWWISLRLERRIEEWY